MCSTGQDAFIAGQKLGDVRVAIVYGGNGSSKITLRSFPPRCSFLGTVLIESLVPFAYCLRLLPSPTAFRLLPSPTVPSHRTDWATVNATHVPRCPATDAAALPSAQACRPGTREEDSFPYQAPSTPHPCFLRHPTFPLAPPPAPPPAPPRSTHGSGGGRGGTCAVNQNGEK